MSSHRRRVIAALAGPALLAGGLAGCASDDPPPTPTVTASPSDASSDPAQTPDGSTSPAETESKRPGRPKVLDVVATGLAAPWGIDFLPDGQALVTERDTGRVLAIAAGQRPREVGVISETAAGGPGSESGLLGLAVSPDFTEDSTVYLYVTTSADNRVVRADYDGTRLGETEVVLDGIPNGNIHDGGRMVFGPDGHLYISTGEIGQPELAQDRSSLAGKILRIDTDGNPAPGNPDPDSPVFSWGHRNVQGLAFDADGRLWASEFGSKAFDELNLIEAGGNYGWPEVEGRGDLPDFIDPQVVWSTDDASPSGLAFTEGHLWLAALRGQRLWRIDLDGDQAGNPTDFFVGKHGRIRTVAVAPDGNLWVSTSNRDGRGNPGPDDDRILLISPHG